MFVFLCRIVVFSVVSSVGWIVIIVDCDDGGKGVSCLVNSLK